ncbi:hypothetical protein DVH24_014021 [Malus domestica]|uniref:Uncharacterized protein n=1 Tax=Malus domestica TaxID=3750 RepID=A0A498JF20_MALDO|nr:hypothetical protein DVH24_014021 [Malus domestica]
MDLSFVSRTTQNLGVFKADTMSYTSFKDRNPRSGDVTFYEMLTDVVETDEQSLATLLGSLQSIKDTSQVLGNFLRQIGGAPHRTGRNSYAQLTHKNQFNEYLEERRKHE